MSPTRSKYKELGLELVSLENKSSRTPKRPLMAGENKDDGTGDPFKLLIEESLTQQRNEMMDSFAQILRRLPTGDASSSSRDATPFKVQINFDIPIFAGHIDADDVDKWLNLLEGYFSVHNFSNREKITFLLLKVIPHVKDWWETFCVLVVEPDYLPDLEVFYFQPCLYAMKYLHPRSMYTLPRRGVQRGGTPSAGSGGDIPPRMGGLGASEPLAGIRGQSPRSKNYLVKLYCNFIVNLDRSL
jgi:hypothetical protein